MSIIYWLIALWIVIGFIVAIAFGAASGRDPSDTNAIRTVKHRGGFGRQPVPHVSNVRRARPASHDIGKAA